MTNWAVQILHNPIQYPMFATATRAFGQRTVLARVEWHAADARNPTVHRGVTLYGSASVVAPKPKPGDPNPGEPAPLARGIDVSGYQPTIDWAAVAASGVSFAFIKATEGTGFNNRAFEEHWQGAKHAGVLRGAYHYFRPRLDSALQAQHFISSLRDPGELPPVLDLETSDSMSPSRVVAGAHAWLDQVQARFGRAIIYTSPAFWHSTPQLVELASTADLWLGQWTSQRPPPLTGWLDWTFWQHTNKASVSGLPPASRTDADVFNGSLAELRAYSASYLSVRTRLTFDTTTIA
jgi:lysozyme